ncbi:GntR family transcriptional regulator [Suicoccus acidiformans]|uniref:GntR family transcriptional regulator n=1 Tax=Suicoccus acidiformans TaxID=2036206 RepID=UPI0013C2C594|nr:GntR family transcriptional regulator [Suicoccus acidiformans]
MTLKEKAYKVLRQQIVNQELPPGTPLIETDIAEQLGMSRTPVREAIRRLAQDGLVVNMSSRTTIVSQINQHDVEEIFTVRIALETLALEESFTKITQEEINSLRRQYDLLEDNFTYSEAYKIDLNFHALWVENSGNQRLANILDMLNGQTERYRRYSHKVEERSQASINEHLAILDQIEAQNLTAAKEALASHLTNTMHNIQDDASLHSFS